MSTPVTLTALPLPFRFSHLDWDTTFRTFVQHIDAQLPGNYNTFNYGNTPPAVADRDKPWLRTDASGTPDRWYVYYNGLWIWPHPIPPNSGFVQMYDGDATALETEDGGSAGAVTDYTGPFWEIIADFNGRSPMGVGNVGGVGTGTAIALDANIGEEKHVQTEDELATHNHDTNYVFEPVTLTPAPPPAPSGQGTYSGGGGYRPNLLIEDAGGKDVGGVLTTQGANVVHPVRGINFIRRTARVYYVLTGI